MVIKFILKVLLKYKKLFVINYHFDPSQTSLNMEIVNAPILKEIKSQNDVIAIETTYKTDE